MHCDSLRSCLSEHEQDNPHVCVWPQWKYEYGTFHDMTSNLQIPLIILK